MNRDIEKDLKELIEKREVDAYWDDTLLQWVFIPNLLFVEREIKRKNGTYEKFTKEQKRLLLKNTKMLQEKYKDCPKYQDYGGSLCFNQN